MSFFVMISGKNYIGFDLRADGAVKFKSFNAADNRQNPWEFVEATELELNEAASKAQKAFRIYRKLNPVSRAAFLRTIRLELINNRSTLCEVFCLESSLTLSRAEFELGRTCEQLSHFAELLESGNFPPTKSFQADDPSKPVLKKTMIPLGPIAVFGSSNFPFAYSTIGGDTASALAAGCSVVVKSHPLHPATGELVASIIIHAAKEHSLPDGVFSNLNAVNYAIGTKLVVHPSIKGVGFTGSLNGGRALYNLAATRIEPIPVFAEMGSINPVIVHSSALDEAENWAKKYAASLTSGVGQFCTNPGLLIGIRSEAFSKFLQLLSDELAKIPAEAMLHPSMHDNFENHKTAVLSQNGVRRLNNETDAPVNFADKVVALTSGSDFIANEKLHHEVFGPFTLAVQCATEVEMLEVIASIDGQLTGTILLDQYCMDTATELIDALTERVGRIIFNGVPTGVEVTAAQHHGGPYPATTDSRFTAVGPDAIFRWLRPIVYQNFPSGILPSEFKD